MGFHQTTARARPVRKKADVPLWQLLSIGKSGPIVQNGQTFRQPRKRFQAGYYGLCMQKTPQRAGDNVGNFIGPVVRLKQGNHPRKLGKGKRIDINLALKPSGAQKTKRGRDCPPCSRCDQPKNRLIAVQFNPTLRLKLQPGQMRGDLPPHQLTPIIVQKRQGAQRIQAARRPIQIVARSDHNEWITQQGRFCHTGRQFKRARSDADIKAMAGNTVKDCMAGRGLQRKIALGQNAGQLNCQFRRYLSIEIVDDANTQAAQAGHIHQRHRGGSVPKLRHRVADMHQIGTSSAGDGQRTMAMINQDLPECGFEFFQLLRSGRRAKAQIGRCLLQAAGAGNFFEHLKGAQGNRFAKNLRQDYHCWLEEVSGQDASNKRGTPFMTDVFRKSFTQQEPISEKAIAQAADVMRTGRLHRYNVAPGEVGPVAEFERAFADWLGVPYALALASGGQALQIALRAAGVKPGDRVLTNGFTLAPVPGAIAAVGARPLLVETNENLRPDLHDLAAKAAKGKARVLMLSNMRGHLPDMEAVQAICVQNSLLLMEDCAHTMGAAWKGKQSGTFGIAGCFSTQTYKHMNSGEGGILTSDDPAFMARATVLSGSYMLYSRHGAGPDVQYFDDARYDMPNCSARMDAVRATLLLDQIGSLQDRILRWNERYHTIEAGLAGVPGLTLPRRPNEESYVGSSIQFLVPKSWDTQNCTRFTDATAARGVEVKWFGAAEPKAFTSRYDSWHYAAPDPLPQTDAVLARLFDMRLPLTFDVSDCALIAQILADEFILENRYSNPTGP